MQVKQKKRAESFYNFLSFHYLAIPMMLYIKNCIKRGI